MVVAITKSNTLTIKYKCNYTYRTVLFKRNCVTLKCLKIGSLQHLSQHRDVHSNTKDGKIIPYSYTYVNTTSYVTIISR